MQRDRRGRPHHATARAVHGSHAREGARGLGHRTPVHVRVDHQHDHERARVRVEEGQRARTVVDGVREDAAARALLRASRRLRVHRRDGRGARRSRAGRGRVREVVAQLLLRQRVGGSPRARLRRAPRHDRHERGQRGAHRRGCRRQRDPRARLANRRDDPPGRREVPGAGRPAARRAHGREVHRPARARRRRPPGARR